MCLGQVLILKMPLLPTSASRGICFFLGGQAGQRDIFDGSGKFQVPFLTQSGLVKNASEEVHCNTHLFK